MTELPEDDPVIVGWSDAEVSGDRINVHEGPIVAGDPDGARVEVTGDGLHAYDETGTETAHIKGEGGEFVGGSFRTSDHLPGQVTLSNTSYMDSGSGAEYPGVRVTPIDTSSTETPPGIGPNGNGMVVTSGRDTSGARAFTIYAPDRVQNTWRSGNETSSMYAARGDATIYIEDSLGVAAQISANETRSVVHSRAGGINRYFRLDSIGVWVGTERSGALQWYNLEETAQDSAWQSFPVRSGITQASATAWRNKGGVIYLRGELNSSWAAGWNLVVSGLSGTAPETEMRSVAPVGSTSNYLIRMTAGGSLEVYAPTAGSQLINLSGLIYPLG